MSSLAFLDHFDFTPLDFEAWQARMRGVTVDPTQWIVAEFDGQMVGYVLGSNTYASDDCGYVASIGVLREHRGKVYWLLARQVMRGREAKRIGSNTLSPTSRWSFRSMRPAAVAGQFYPVSGAELEHQLDSMAP